jgi:hypothetical protein
MRRSARHAELSSGRAQTFLPIPSHARGPEWKMGHWELPGDHGCLLVPPPAQSRSRLDARAAGLSIVIATTEQVDRLLRSLYRAVGAPVAQSG